MAATTITLTGLNTLGFINSDCQNIHNAILAGGIVSSNYPSGSGFPQYMDVTVPDPPPPGNTKTIYVSNGAKQTVNYAFSDSLSGNFPFTFHITYWCQRSFLGPYNSRFNLQLTIDTIGPTSAPIPLFNYCGIGAFVDSTDWPTHVYVSSGPARLCVAMLENASPGDTGLCEAILFNIERTKDFNGNDTSEGIILQTTLGSCYYIYSQLNPEPASAPCVNMVLPYASGTPVAGHNVFTFPQQGPSSGGYTMTKPGGAIGAMPITPFNFRPYEPGYGLLVQYDDLEPYASTTVSMSDGVGHTYLALQQQRNDSWFSPQVVNAHLLMRFE